MMRTTLELGHGTDSPMIVIGSQFLGMNKDLGRAVEVDLTEQGANIAHEAGSLATTGEFQPKVNSPPNAEN